AGWSGDVASADLTVSVAMDQSKQLTARFVRTYSLSLRTDGGGTFTMDPPAGPYPDSSMVTLAAAPASGWTFLYWLGDASGTNPNPCVSALFATLAAGQFSLTVISDGRGDVRVSPLANYYGAGEEVTLTAVPEPGQAFTNWSGDATGADNPLVVTMDKSKTIT